MKRRKQTLVRLMVVNVEARHCERSVYVHNFIVPLPLSNELSSADLVLIACVHLLGRNKTSPNRLKVVRLPGQRQTPQTHTLPKSKITKRALCETDA